MKLSVIIACRNDQAQLNATIQSIHDTANSDVEIVVVDDCSIVPLLAAPSKDVLLLRNQVWKGIGASRHIGIEHCSGDLILITDSHMRFQPGWLQAVMEYLPSRPRTVLCGKCIALDTKHPTMESPNGFYEGANMNITRPAEPNPRYRVLVPQWAKHREGDLYLLSAMMGALYAMHKHWFMEIGGLRFLRYFGGDEETLSVKTLMAGGEIVMFKRLCAGHFFRLPRENPPYIIEARWIFYNLLTVIQTCCPPDVAIRMVKLIGQNKEVQQAKSALRFAMEDLSLEAFRLSHEVFNLKWDEYVALVEKLNAQ